MKEVKVTRPSLRPARKSEAQLRGGRWRVLLLVASSVALVALFGSATPRVAAFDTYKYPVHEQITDAALKCSDGATAPDCFETASLYQISGALDGGLSSFVGAVGEPDCCALGGSDADQE